MPELAAVMLGGSLVLKAPALGSATPDCYAEGSGARRQDAESKLALAVAVGGFASPRLHHTFVRKPAKLRLSSAVKKALQLSSASLAR